VNGPRDVAAVATASQVYRCGGLDPERLTAAIIEVAAEEALPEAVVRERWAANERFIRFMVSQGALMPSAPINE
jgi:hypothetical protein